MVDVAVIGGGLAGMAAAWRLALLGRSVTLIERAPALGGLAGSFEREGRTYPLGYHQILEGDAPLLDVLDRFGLKARIAWKRLPMAFLVDGGLHPLSHPQDLLAFPLPLRAKAGLLRLGLHALLLKPQAGEGEEDAARWIRRIAGDAALERFFDPLCRLKFERPASELSAAWLRERLLGREGSGRFGAIPGGDWTRLLVEAMEGELRRLGVDIRVGVGARALERGPGGSIARVALQGGGHLRARAVLATLPTPLLFRLLPDYEDAALRAVAYSGVVSCVLATRQRLPLPYYWTNCLRPALSFGGIFRLDLLNPTLGAPGDTILNFATHVGVRRPGSLMDLTEGEVIDAYLQDFEGAFGIRLEPRWVHLAQIPHYSPIFVRGYTNPALRSPFAPNLYLAGNFVTCPTLASTGSAMASGRRTASQIHQDLRRP